MTLGERIRDLLQDLPVECGLTHGQMSYVLEWPVKLVRNEVAKQVRFGVVRPMPATSGRLRRWRRTLVDQGLAR